MIIFLYKYVNFDGMMEYVLMEYVNFDGLPIQMLSIS